MTAQPKVKALAVIWNGSRILVFEGQDEIKDERFYRPLGGTVEFGERGVAALERELREEIGARLHNVTFLGRIESVFTYRGMPGHELVLIYSASLADPKLYAQERIAAIEADGSPFEAVWVDPRQLDGAWLYPEGLDTLLSMPR